MSAPAKLATTGVHGHHSRYVDSGASTPAPDSQPDYEADPAVPGTAILVVDSEGWATVHMILSRVGGTITFGPRLAWPDGSTAARKVPE